MRKRNKKRRKKPEAKPFKLPKETRALLSYWRASLLDAQRIEISDRDIVEAGVEASFADIEKGLCPPELVPALFTKYKKLNTRSRKQAKANQAQDVVSSEAQGEIPVLLCPIRMSKVKRNTPGPPKIELLWIPANLSQNGKFSVPPRALPWIPRIHLEPLVQDNNIAIGSVADVEDFTKKRPIAPNTSWREYLAFCNSFFKAVSGSGFSRLAVPEYQRENYSVLLADTNMQGAYSGSIRVYEEILDGKRHPGLLPKIARLKKPNRSPFSQGKYTLSRSATKHCGQFEASYPLSPTQRRAVHRFFELPDNDFLCVTGPPGTGKTTFLQSIVASLWVLSARSAGASPPIILACSATNQAVTNIIESFGKAQTKAGPLAGRWLPGIQSYGTFCCSEMRLKEAQGFQVELRSGKGLSCQMENWEYLQKAEAHFLAKFAAWHSKPRSLKKALSVLHHELKREFAALYRSVAEARDGSLLDWLTSGFGIFSKRSYQELFNALTGFDQSHRHRAFQLATHYWEARWLLETSEELSRRERKEDSALRFRGSEVDWRRRAMLTPAFVSTLSMAPRFFSWRRSDRKALLDLLIFDEAGQIPPDIGAACCALAEQALIVGDPLQLEPVWNIPPHIDISNLTRNRLMKAKDHATEYTGLKRRGILASANSLMELGIHSSGYEDGNSIGVFLSEHRRSVPEIVRFCNTLAYRGRLEPKRAEMSNRKLPALGYAHVEGFSEKLGQSRMNRREAECISAWIEDKREMLSESYQGLELSEIVAIITPFAAQKRILSERIGKRYPQMTIGTVNSLQGAERPIVIFSPVYDQSNEFTFFFDRSINMINVAVSRAQDSFLVFGDMRIFNQESAIPSGILARFLFSKQENEIVDFEPVRRKEVAKENVSRLTTLEEHQEALEQAFQHAKRELIIVSPTISIAAIEADGIAELLRGAVDRGVRVRIFTDMDLDMPDGKLKENAEAGRKVLREAGAELSVVNKIHNKAVAIDDEVLVEGSFNWLSAVRRRGSRHQKLEISWCYRGPVSAEEIEKLREELQARTRSKG